MADESVRDWELERYLLGELPPGRMADIGARLQADPELARKVDDLRRSDKEILALCPPEAVLPLARREAEKRERKLRHSPRRRTFWRQALYSAPIIAAAVVLLVVVVSRTPSPGLRFKGQPGIDLTKTQLLVYKKTEGGNVLLKQGDSVRLGDLLQLAYVPAGKKFGIILSIDGNGLMTPHFPPDGRALAPLKNAALVLLPNSYELDQAPEFEKFFFITAMSDIPARDVLDKARALARSSRAAAEARLELPENVYGQYSILLRKVK